ncbi:MAG: SGNH/GDSL hydrolase family protein [Clostridia bacterium]|nr:SGNH/GDSL hydrolase family protein [Clostridia bacterium]
MHITNEVLKNYISGWIRAWETDGYLYLSRFTEEQAEYLRPRHDPKQLATSSMFIEFITDATEFSFECRYTLGSSQKCFGIDLLVDGINTNCTFKGDGQGEFLYNATLKAGTKRVTVFLPNLACAAIRNFEINAPIFPYERKCTFLALGDSITQGYVTKHPHLTYVNIVAQLFDAKVVNQAIGGDVFDKNNVDDRLKEIDPDFITVAYGTNDWSTGIDIRSISDAYFERLREVFPDIPIFALVPIHRNGIDGILKNGITLEEARLIIEETATKHGATVIDARDFVPYQEDFYCDKVLHPSEIGFIFYGNNLYNELKKYL